MLPPNLLQVGEVSDHRGVLTAEAQVDKVLDIRQLQLVGHGLELGVFALAEALQTLGEIVQFVQIDR